MFNLGDFAFDRMVGLIAESNDEIAYILKQCQSGTIDVSAESSDVTDKNGTLVRRTYKAKTGNLSITNAMLNVNALNATSGSDMEVATTEKKLPMPKIITLTAGATAVLDGVVSGSIRVKAFMNNGATGATIALADDGTATATEYGYDADTKTITAPSDTTTKYVVKYMREVANGAIIRNAANEFPDAVEATIKALIVDPCVKGGVKACYIYLPNLNVSPEVSIPLSAGETFDYKGDLGVDYCSDDKDLYVIYFPDEMDEDDL